MARVPRGIRNNNPGNIERGDPWHGLALRSQRTPEQMEENRFAVFRSPEYGIRAIAKVLKTYQHLHGLSTIEEIINRWAPGSENDTESYISSVEKQTGIGRDKPINVENYDVAKKLVSAIITHENGTNPYSEQIITSGLALAGLRSDVPPVPREKVEKPISISPPFRRRQEEGSRSIAADPLIGLGVPKKKQSQHGF